MKDKSRASVYYLRLEVLFWRCAFISVLQYRKHFENTWARLCKRTQTFLFFYWFDKLCLHPTLGELICLQTRAGLVDKNKNKRISSVSKQLTWCVEVVLGSILVIIELDAGKNCNLSSRSTGNTSCNSILQRTHSVCLNKINDATVIWRHFIKIQHLIYPAQPLVYIFPRELWSSKISNGVN